MVANSEAAAWALEQAVRQPLGPPAGPGNTHLGVQNSMPSLGAQLPTHPVLARSPGVAHVMQKEDPRSPLPQGCAAHRSRGVPARRAGAA